MAEGHRKRKKKQTSRPQVSCLQPIRKKWGGRQGRWEDRQEPLTWLFRAESTHIVQHWKLPENSPELSTAVAHSSSYVRLFVTPWPAAHQASLSFTISRSVLKLVPLSQWSHPTISSSLTLFSSCLQSFPASGSFPMSQFFLSGGQSIEASALASVLPMNIQEWFPLGLTGWISLLIHLLFI